MAIMFTSLLSSYVNSVLNCVSVVYMCLFQIHSGMFQPRTGKIGLHLK